MKKTILFIAIVFVFCNISAQNKNEISKYTSQKIQNGFIENKGQIHDQNFNANPDVKYLLCLNDGMNVQLKKNSFSYDTYKTEIKEKKKDILSEEMASFIKSEKKITYYFHRVDIELVGANENPQIITEEPSSDYLNYYNAITPESGATNVRSYKKIIYKNIYPDIDMVFYTPAGSEKPFEYTFIVHPGADAKLIRLHYTGANQTTLTKNKIKIDVKQGSFCESIPASWINETNDKLKVQYKLIENNVYGFDIPLYSSKQTLIIDPNPNIDWGTYYGGTGYEEGYGITCDTNGNVFATGETSSSTAIATSGAHQTIYAGNTDALVVKFSNIGVRQWATYYGGSGGEDRSNTVCDANGNVFISGYTTSSASIATIGSHQSSFGGGTYDAFIVKFNNSGVRQWASYYGGSNNDFCTSITSDGSGNVYLVGGTNSTNSISTAGAHHSTLIGAGDAFIVKFNNSGVRQWGSYYGGSGNEGAMGVACDGSGNVFFIGSTPSTDSISTIGAYHKIYGGGTLDAYIVKFNSNGVCQWGTYYGGSADDEGLAITCDFSGNVYISGYTSSIDSIATTESHQPDFGGGSRDYFVAKLNNSGARLWGTYYGGSDVDDGFSGVICDSIGNLYLVGGTQSTNAISTTGAYQETYGGIKDAFIVKFNYSGVRQWATYYGGSNLEVGNDIACDGNGRLFIIGYTSSTNSIATAGAYQTTYGGGAYDLFVAKFSTCYNPYDAGIISGATNVCQGQNSVTYTVPAITYATSYVWSLPSGASGTSATNSITVNFSSSASFGNITVKGHNSCGDGATSTLPITVNPLPASAGNISGATTVCQGQNSVIYTVPAISNATSYVWSLPTGASGTSVTNSITVYYGISAISGDITVKGNNSCGFGATSLIAVNVNPLPASAGTISGATSVCTSQSSITYIVPSILNASSYVWSLPNGASGTSSTNNISVDYSSIAVSGGIEVYGHNACGNGGSSIIAVTVNPYPSDAISISGSATVCQGQNSVAYTTTAIANAATYLWSLPSGAIGSSITNTINVNYGISAISGAISVIGHNSCGNGGSAVLPITVNQLPSIAGTISGSSTVCQGQNAVLYAVPTINNSVTYIWSLPNDASGSSSSNIINVNYGSSASSGNIIVKGHNSCGDGISSSLTITVNNKPPTPIATVNLNILHSDAANGNQWYNQNGIIGGATTQDYTPIIEGDYYVIVTSNGCTSTPSNTINVVFTGIEQNAPNGGIKAYPNPVSDELIIEAIGNNGTINFEIYNSVGQIIFKGSLINKTIVQTGSFATGVYLIKLNVGRTFEFKKLVKL
jgi:hypothetical protein